MSIPSATPATLRLLAIIGGVLAVSLLGFYAWSLHGHLPYLRDDADFIIGRDFFNTWLYGRAAVLPDPGRFYDHDVYGAWIATEVPDNTLDHIWSYPPHFLLLAAPFGQLPYLAALAAWTLAGLLALYAAVRGMAPRSFAILTSPAVLFCVIGGQVSLFIAACTIGALRNLERRPWLAGALIACMTIKPQTGLLIPVLLVATRRWRVFFAATICTALMLALTTVIWGPGIWVAYFRLGIPAQLANTRATFALLAPVSPTITTGALLLGLDADWALRIQLLFAGLAALLVAFCVPREPLETRRIALFLACSAFATPYLLAHDLTALAAAAVLLAATPLTPAGTYLVLALYLMPVLQMPLAAWHVPAVSLLPIAFAAWAVWPQVRSPGTPVRADVPG